MHTAWLSNDILVRFSSIRLSHLIKKSWKKRHVPKPIVPAIGSCRKDAGKSLDPAGKHGKYLEYGSIFRGIPAVSRGTSFTWVVDLFVCF
jgi:hypothetical protein